MLERRQSAVGVAPIRKLCRVGARCPTGPNICSRRNTSFTGLHQPCRENSEHLRR